MKKYEYIKWFWENTDKETPILLFYEVDLENERYATRMVEVFSDRTVSPVIEEGFEFVTEAPIPDIEEINREPEFWAETISKEEFQRIYELQKYDGSINFPREK